MVVYLVWEQGHDYDDSDTVIGVFAMRDGADAFIAATRDAAKPGTRNRWEATWRREWGGHEDDWFGSRWWVDEREVS